jgi:hypothetical protein
MHEPRKRPCPHCGFLPDPCLCDLRRDLRSRPAPPKETKVQRFLRRLHLTGAHP